MSIEHIFIVSQVEYVQWQKAWNVILAVNLLGPANLTHQVEILLQSPLGRVASPDEVARTVLFLASEGTDSLTGCIIDVNGASDLLS